MAFVLANGKAYYNAYNFSIDTDPAEQTFAAPSSTAIVNTIITTDRQCLKEKKHYLSANFADQEDAIVSITIAIESFQNGKYSQQATTAVHSKC